MFIIISYAVLTIFFSSVLVYRIKKQKFASYLTEEIGLLATFFIVSLVLEVPIVIKTIAVVSLLAIFIYGSVKNNDT